MDSRSMVWMGLVVVGLALIIALSARGLVQTGEPASALTAAPTFTSEPDRPDEEQPRDVESVEEEEVTVTPQESLAGTYPAPEFPALEWLNTDRPLRLADLEGKVVVLDFWTYGCINCMHVIPDLKRLEAKYADELVVVGVHSAKFENEGDVDNIRQIILRYELEHPVINDKDFVVWRTYGVQAWPTLVVIDPAGNIVGKQSGEGIYDLFDQVIGSLVTEFDAKGEIDRTPVDLKLEREGLPETVLSFPGKVLADAEGERLFIADSNHNRIVVADLETYEVEQVIGGLESGFVDGDFGSARFYRPQGMALSADGRILYVADTENHAIRAVDLVDEMVDTVAGTGQQSRVYPGEEGQGTEVALNSPWDLELVGDYLYVAMAGSHQLWRMDPSSGVIGPWAGSGREGINGGVLASASLAQPSGLTTDGEWIYFADSEASAIRAASLGADGKVRRIVGTGLFDFGDVDGVGDQARLQHPLGVVYNSADGLLYVADTYNSKIKTVDLESRRAETFVGGGDHGWRDGADALFYEPGGLDLAAGKLYVADTNNHVVRVVELGTRETSTVVLRDVAGLLTPAGAGEEFFGSVVTLEGQAVAAGRGVVYLSVALPEGYKFNELAPSLVDWQTGDLIGFEDGGQKQQVAGSEFPLELPVTFQAGRGTAGVDLTILYCEAGKESLCLFHSVRLQVPVEVGDLGDGVLEVDYTLPEPDV
jgi:sugar lactone lactonase YvrE